MTSLDKVAVANLIDDHEQALSEIQEPNPSFKQLAAHPPSDPSTDLKMQDSFQGLRYLKAKYVQLRTKNIFMDTIRNTKSVNDMTTPAEAGRTEVSLKTSKTELRKIKKARKEAQEENARNITDLKQASENRETVKKELERRLRQARAAANGNDVRAILGSRNIAKIESLVDHVDDLDANACYDLISLLREEKLYMERDASQKSAHVNQIRKEVEQLKIGVPVQEADNEKMREQIAENDRNNPEAATLRHECMLQEQLEGVKSSLTGLRVVDVRENGMSFQLNIRLFASCKESGDRQEGIHILDVEFEDEGKTEKPMIAQMALRPPDVSVNDICRKDPNVSLKCAVRTICNRLVTFLQEQDRSEEAIQPAHTGD